MNNFKIIYKILKVLEEALDYDEFDEESISAETLKITEQRWCALMCMLSNEGYVEGVSVRRYLKQKYPQANLLGIRITLRGLEYLNDNSFMKKASDTVKGIVDLIP